MTDDPHDAPPAVRALVRLHRAGWSVGDAATRGDNGRPLWIVSGSNGENLLRAEGGTPGEAWNRAVEQARTLGMLGRGDDEP